MGFIMMIAGILLFAIGIAMMDYAFYACFKKLLHEEICLGGGIFSVCFGIFLVSYGLFMTFCDIHNIC